MRALGWWSVTFIAAANVALGACARSWPTVRPVGNPSFMASRSPVMTIDVLPLDMEIGARPGKNPDEISATFHQYAEPAIAEALRSRGYRLGALIDWNGAIVRPGDGSQYVMTEDEVMATERQLALYNAYQAQRPNEILFPYLPDRLGEVTGSDATLYVGGYGYSGKDGSGITAGKVIIGVLIVAIIVIVVIAAAKGGGGGLGSAAGNVASAAGRAVGGVARVGLRATELVVRGGVEVLKNANLDINCCGDGRYGESYSGQSSNGSTAYPPPPQPAPIYPPAQVSYVPPAPQPAVKIPEMPTSGGSRTYLEMTLVDNRTGQVLWHARQLFHANPGKPGDARQVMLRMLQTLPLRAGQGLLVSSTIR